MSETEKEERKEKFMEEIMKRSVFDSSQFMEAVNQEWNGIIINAKTAHYCQQLIKFLEKIQNATNLPIDSTYVTTISLGDMPMGAGGGFDAKNKTIKLLDTIFFQTGSSIFLHEFSHAIDDKHNLWVEFTDLYKKYIGKLNVPFVEDETNDHKIFADFTPEQFDRAARGNMEYYKVLSVKEFTAVAIQCLFDGAFDSEDDITEKAESLIKQHLNI